MSASFKSIFFIVSLLLVTPTNLELSAEITVYGMVNGSFTSYSFSDAKESGDFFYNSRQIINGLTNATDYKRYAERYHNVLTTNYGTP